MNKMQYVTLDFETYFAADYSLRLKKYNTSSYVRDPQFEVQICSVKIGKKPAKVYTRDELPTLFMVVIVLSVIVKF